MWYEQIIKVAEVTGALLAIGTVLWFFVSLYLRLIQIGKDTAKSKEEREIIIGSLLACLNGLKEVGCNGPVEAGINAINKFLNEQAHK
jgi:hypothetical protein